MSSKLYQQAQGAADMGAQENGGAAGGTDYVDADFSEVDEDDKK